MAVRSRHSRDISGIANIVGKTDQDIGYLANVFPVPALGIRE